MEYLDTPLFGFAISIIAFEIGMYINRKTKISVLNPLIIATSIIIGLLLYFDIEYDIYNKGGSIISFFLGPATVVLAVPLYKQIDKFKANGIIILIGIAVGSLVNIISILYLGKLFGVTDDVILSLVPKSATAAISMEISRRIGGIPALTVAAAVVTGITGNVIGISVYRIFHIKDEVATGVGLGTASHAMGTAKAMELGEVQGAMGSPAISIAGLMTVFLAPWLIWLFN
ncbi:MAG TPA: LrgB family protein [Tepidimicrobium sp.]|nr:LrgB family protein [Tepidimicrobium sp.]